DGRAGGDPVALASRTASGLPWLAASGAVRRRAGRAMGPARGRRLRRSVRPVGQDLLLCLVERDGAVADLPLEGVLLAVLVAGGLAGAGGAGAGTRLGPQVGRVTGSAAELERNQVVLLQRRVGDVGLAVP